MSIDQRHVGFSLPEFQVTLDPSRLAAFAEAVSSDSTVIPATFLKVIEGENNSSRVILDALEVDLRRVLHVEQQFDYLVPMRAGDCLTVRRTVADIQNKRGGTMEFVVIATEFTNQHDQIAARSRQVVLVRHPEQEVRE